MSATDPYHFELPAQRIAHEPSPVRGGSRALFLERGHSNLESGHFAELPSRLRGDECLIVNDTRVIPARIRARRQTGGEVEAFLLRQEGETLWRAWLNPSRRIQPGEELMTTGASLKIIERFDRWWRVSLPAGELERIGEVPLPPYIERAPLDSRLNSLDLDRYQTVYANQAGAVAAPTAGLHFTADLLSALEARGIPVIRTTLHVGPGTFTPIRAKTIEEHRVDPELFEVSSEARNQLATAKSEGRSLICVGTTSMRLIESLPDLSPGPDIEGECDLTILPGHEFRHADGLITNFHLPRSSLLVLVSAFHGRERTLAAYQHAIDSEFRFYSYGDSMVILPKRDRTP